ncbi:MAG TPA: DUF6356 family protein [Acetobacteraceae bacterium]|nr:DUF6356 family protein [Acetobacteraceae bacterium]
MFHSAFVEHPRSVGESYFQHQRVALSFAGALFLAALAAALHAVLPCACKTTASTTVARLHKRMASRRAL